MRRVVVALALFATPALFAQSSPVYRITHTYTLGGDGSWDYVVPDPPQSPRLHRPSESRHGRR